jgi:hypothetical protein
MTVHAGTVDGPGGGAWQCSQRVALAGGTEPSNASSWTVTRPGVMLQVADGRLVRQAGGESTRCGISAARRPDYHSLPFGVWKSSPVQARLQPARLLAAWLVAGLSVCCAGSQVGWQAAKAVASWALAAGACSSGMRIRAV